MDAGGKVIALLGGLALATANPALSDVSSAGPALTCDRFRMSDVEALTGPAVLVLGVRQGTQPDLWRVGQVVKRLVSNGEPVTLALQAVHAEKQPVLDDYASGKLDPSDLPGLLQWSRNSGFPFRPYERLVTGSLLGARVLAIGGPPMPRPANAEVPSPPGYLEVLYDGMAGYPMPPTLESRFVRYVGWQDHELAQAALTNWDGAGVLVIVADRLHVEGGKGVQWQAQRLTEHPVHGVVLAPGARCLPGYTYW